MSSWPVKHLFFGSHNLSRRPLAAKQPPLCNVRYCSRAARPPLVQPAGHSGEVMARCCQRGMIAAALMGPSLYIVHALNRVREGSGPRNVAGDWTSTDGPPQLSSMNTSASKFFPSGCLQLHEDAEKTDGAELFTPGIRTENAIRPLATMFLSIN